MAALPWYPGTPQGAKQDEILPSATRYIPLWCLKIGSAWLVTSTSYVSSLIIRRFHQSKIDSLKGLSGLHPLELSFS